LGGYMKRAEAEKLLGGYATGTLSEAERRLLYEAALGDQELFDALADEEALRELLAEPEARKRLLEALAEPKVGLWEGIAAWWRRPVAWGVAGSVAVAAMLVVMLLPVYQTMTRKPAVMEVAVRTAPAGRHAAEEQPREAEAGPVELAKKAEPSPVPAAPPAAVAVPVRTAPAGRHAAEGPEEEARAAARIEPPRPAAAAPAVEQVVAERAAEKREIAEAEAPAPKQIAKSGAVGGVIGGVVASQAEAMRVEADARALYYAGESKAAQRPAVMAMRARQAADVAAAAPGGVTGLRYSVLRRAASGEYEEVAPDTVFAAGDVVRLSVEANQGGVLRLLRQDDTVAELAIGARQRRVIPAGEGLKLEGPTVLAIEVAPAGARKDEKRQPWVRRAVEERAVYVVEPAGGPLRAEIALRVR